MMIWKKELFNFSAVKFHLYTHIMFSDITNPDDNKTNRLTSMLPRLLVIYMAAPSVKGVYGHNFDSYSIHRLHTLKQLL